MASVDAGGQCGWSPSRETLNNTKRLKRQTFSRPTNTPVILSREASEGSNQRERLQITARPLRHSHPFALPPGETADAGIPFRRYPFVRLSHLLFSCFVIPVNSDPICGIAFALFLDISSLFIHHVINRWVDNRRVDKKGAVGMFIGRVSEIMVRFSKTGFTDEVAALYDAHIHRVTLNDLFPSSSGA